MNTFNLIYALPVASDSVKSETIGTSSSEIINIDELNEKLWNSSLRGVKNCIGYDKNGNKILDLSNASIFELNANLKAIKHCIENKEDGIYGVKLSYRQMYQDYIVRNMSKERQHYLMNYSICNIFKAVKNSSLVFYLDYILLDYCIPLRENPFFLRNYIMYHCMDYPKSNCDSILINKQNGNNVEIWLEDFMLFSKWNKNFNKTQIKNIISCGTPLTDIEKQRIKEVFIDKHGIENLNFIEDPRVNPVNISYTQSLYDPKCILPAQKTDFHFEYKLIENSEDINKQPSSKSENSTKTVSLDCSSQNDNIIVRKKDNIETKYTVHLKRVIEERKPTRLEPVYLANVLLHLQQIDDSFDRVKCSPDKSKRKEISKPSVASIFVSKNLLEADKILRTVNKILCRNNYNELTNYILKRATSGIKVDSVAINHFFAEENIQTISETIKKLKLAGVNKVIIVNGERYTPCEYSPGTCINATNLLNICSKLNISVELTKDLEIENNIFYCTKYKFIN